jgi:hypothetical protein
MRVGTLTGATRVSTSPTHSCAVLSDHSLWCWGANLYGDLGNGTSVPRSGSPPVRVLGPGSLGFFSAVDVVSTFYSTCAIATLPDGNAYCWGAAADFTLGYPGATGMSAPAGRVAF